MKTYAMNPLWVAALVLIASCSSTPTTTGLLDQTRTDYAVAQANPDVGRYAAQEFTDAGVALAAANTAARNNDDPEKIDHMAYIAKQQIAVAQETAKQRAAEASATAAINTRDRVRLDERTREADQAKADSQNDRVVAQIAQSETMDAKRDSAMSKDKMEDAQARTAQLEMQLADLSARKTDRGLVITLSDVLFDTNQARLNDAGLHTARKLADFLRDNPERSVAVEGYTDSTGTVIHNQELSERRADAVRRSLQEMGISPDRVSVKAYGPSYPVASNDSAKNRQLNRRVEIVLSDDHGRILQR